MTGITSAETLEWVTGLGLPLAGFVTGFLTSRWTLTKKDRKDLEQKYYENTTKLIEDHDAAYHAYTVTLGGYSDAASANLGLFFEVATKGDRYLLQLNRVATAILSGKVDKEARDQTLLPIIRSAASRTLPDHYGTLRAIADKHGFTYNGELRRTDYGAIYDVVELYGPGPKWGDR